MSSLAGQPAPAAMRVNVPRLVTAYYAQRPEPSVPPAASAWFAARPSGTEDVYKIHAESFRGADHLRLVLEAAQTIVDDALREVA